MVANVFRLGQGSHDAGLHSTGSQPLDFLCTHVCGDAPPLRSLSASGNDTGSFTQHGEDLLTAMHQATCPRLQKLVSTVLQHPKRLKRDVAPSAVPTRPLELNTTASRQQSHCLPGDWVSAYGKAPMSSGLSQELSKVHSWDTFDVFKVRQLSSGRPLYYTLLAALHELDLINEFALPMEPLCAFLEALEDTYNPANAYHTSTHAADVVQTLAALLLASQCNALTAPSAVACEPAAPSTSGPSNGQDQTYAAVAKETDSACDAHGDQAVAPTRLHAALQREEQLAVLLAAAMHDSGHPGLTNEFQAHTQGRANFSFSQTAPGGFGVSSGIASRSANSRGLTRSASINEQLHVRTGIALLQQAGHDFLARVDPSMRVRMLGIMRTTILFSDMSLHAALLASFSRLLSELGSDLATWPEERTQQEAIAPCMACAGSIEAAIHGSKQQQSPSGVSGGCYIPGGKASLGHQVDDAARSGAGAAGLASAAATVPADDIISTAGPRATALSWLLHCADVSNPLKRTELSVQWAERVLTELWAQGDQEQQLGAPYSLLCDRSTTNIPSSQLGFLSGIVLPSWQLLGQLDPGVSTIALKHVDANKAYHEGLLAEGKNAFR